MYNMIKKIVNYKMVVIGLVHNNKLKLKFYFQKFFDESSFHRFRCNICGKLTSAPLVAIKDRETVSCCNCGSNRRFRTIIAALSIELFGKNIPMPSFKESKHLTGIGMSDNEIYAKELRNKFNYTNTYYHQNPKLDIVSLDDHMLNVADFVISSDVFEHVPPPVCKAFNNLYKILKKGGLCIFSVPYKKIGETVEHYPSLFEYKIINNKGLVYLENTAADGKKSLFANPVFHGGSGSTLEMRIFSEKSLMDEIRKSGFIDIKIYKENFEEIGIILDGENTESLIISFRKP